MVQTKKFSQFNGPDDLQDGDIIVGLRNGDNHQFNASGLSGAGGAVTVVIDQDNHGFAKGDWVYIDGTSTFIKALATTPVLAEIAGVVIKGKEADLNKFTLQVVGYIGPGVFTGLTPGGVYFLSDQDQGLMTLNEPVINGEVSLPLFIAYTADSGFVRQSRGVIIGGMPPIGDGSGSTSPSLHTITQPNPPGPVLSKGQIVRINSSGIYVPADATSLTNAQAVGVVTEVLPNDQYVIQTEGYNAGAITQDDQGNPLVPGTAYYLSTDTGIGGLVTSVPPSGIGQAVKPIFICEQGGGSPAGYILPQFPDQVTAANTNPNIVTFTQAGNDFAIGDFLYIDSVKHYAKGSALALDTSQIVGCVIALAGDNVTIQTEGYNVGALSVDENGNALIPGKVYYLSFSQPGKLTANNPDESGLISKPLYACEQINNGINVDAGYILPQRPIESFETADVNVVTINQPNHNLSKGDWVYLSGAKNYAKGIATSITTSQVVGLVIDAPDNNNFVLQTSGYNTDVVDKDDLGNDVVPGTVYYLSATVPGKLHAAEPSANNYSKPLYACEQKSDGVTYINAGFILEQRPLVVSAGGGGGGGGPSVVASINFKSNVGTQNNPYPLPAVDIRTAYNITSVVILKARSGGLNVAGYVNFTNPLASTNYMVWGNGTMAGASNAPAGAFGGGPISSTIFTVPPSTTTQCSWSLGLTGNAYIGYPYSYLMWIL